MTTTNVSIHPASPFFGCPAPCPCRSFGVSVIIASTASPVCDDAIEDRLAGGTYSFTATAIADARSFDLMPRASASASMRDSTVSSLACLPILSGCLPSGGAM